MVVALLAVMAVGLGLILIKAVPILVGIVLIIAGLVAVLAIGDRRDRPRQRGIGEAASRLDPNRAVIPVGTEPEAGQGMRDQVDANVWTQPPPRQSDDR